MKPTAIWTCLVLLCGVVPAWANPTISVGSHELLPNTPSQVILIAISPGSPGAANGFGGADGNEQTIPAIDLNLAILDDPLSLNAPLRPTITSIDLVGAGLVFNTVANTGNVDFPPFNVPGWNFSRSTSSAIGEVLASGNLARVTIDTTGLYFPGGWTLSLTNPLIGLPTDVGYDPFLLGLLGQGSVTLLDGDIHITPEPSGLTLSAVGLIGLACLRRRRRPRRA